MNSNSPEQQPPFEIDIFRASTQYRVELLPASYEIRGSLAVPRLDYDYLESEFNLERLEGKLVSKWLWVVGRRGLPRPLHRQRLLERTVIVVEELDMHLVWGSGRLFLKPLPRFLLVPDFWSDLLKCNSLCGCWKKSAEGSNNKHCRQNLIRRNALGFLLSYVSLVRYESDFLLAQENHLLPHELQWSQWQQLSRELLACQTRHEPVAERWKRGELRLNRLNKIYWCGRIHPRYTYLTRWNQYNTFWADNIAWIGTTTVYVVVVLTAMQVGLATEDLQPNKTFQKVAYGFTVFSITALPGFLGALALYFVIVVINNAHWAWNHEKSEVGDRGQQNRQFV